MSRYPTPPQSQTDTNSIGLSAYQQRSLPTNQLRPAGQGGLGLPINPNKPIPHQRQKPSTPASPTSQETLQMKSIVRTHYDLLNSWLHQPSENSSKSPPNRTNPRDKLTRLTRLQFQELSTDVYDELVRRIGRGDPDENQPSPHLRGDQFLASREDFHPKRNQARQKLATLPRPRFRDLASDVFYELERRYPEFAQSEPLAPLNQNNNTPLPTNNFNPSPSRLPPNLPPHPPRSLNAPMNGSTGMVKNDLVVPDKSTLVIENTDDAYDDQISTDPKPVEPPSRSISIENTETRDVRKGPLDRRRSGSLSSIKYISHKQNGSDTYAAMNRPPSRDQKNSSASRFSVNEYDRRISVMQSKIVFLEKELLETQSSNSRTKSNLARLEECEEELLRWKRLCEEQTRQLEELQQTMQDERKSKFNELTSAEQEIKQLQREISDLNRRIESAPTARSNNNSNDTVVVKLKAEVVELVDELRQMQRRQDELLAEQENLQEIIRDLENAVSHHKKRYEAAKTELRTVKRSSTQYSHKEFIPNEKLPLSENGAIVDIHFTMFTTSIDDLLRAGRSNVTNELISIMRSIIDSVGDIDEDVQQFEVNPSLSNRLSLEEQEKLDVLKGRINATLSNLITACKNHVTSFGLSPISLLDAAASHLCYSLVELVQLVGMRRVNASEIEMYENYHSKRSNYDDDDSNRNGGIENAGFMLRPAVNKEVSNRNGGAGSPRSWNDESPAPLKINKDRDNEFGPSEKNGLRNGTPNSNSNKLSNFLERNRTPTGGGSNSPVTRPIRPLNSSERSNLEQQPTPSRTQQMASKFEDLRSPSGFEYASNASDIRDSASGSSTNLDKVFDSPPRGGLPTRNFPRSARQLSESSSSRPTQVSGISKSSSNDPDLEKLKLYLESQTESIVGSIQTLLSTVRSTTMNDPTTTTEMRNNMDQIIQVVSNIMERCSSLVSNNPKLESILDELDQNCKKLHQLNDQGGAASFSKQVKQAMAAASFGVAKAIKELNAHVSGNEESLL